MWHSNGKYRRVVWQCNHKFEGDTKCHTPHLTDEEIEEKFVSAVNQLLENRDTIIADIDLVKASVYDTASLSEEQSRLSDELALVTELVQKSITENAHHAIDQREYQQRYDALTERYNRTRGQLDTVTEQIEQTELSRAALTDFQKALRSRQQLLTKFDKEAWYTLVDYATVYSKDDIRFTFKDGTEIEA